ncbi:hypothetical protein [Haloechinothrix salitolerans]|uniref:Secreted protein n=1 Tax=Haloechinothrix salitolerans TaxID=926830 RepID=A0ABW2C8N8_9PSEU
MQPLPRFGFASVTAMLVAVLMLPTGGSALADHDSDESGQVTVVPGDHFRIAESPSVRMTAQYGLRESESDASRAGSGTPAAASSRSAPVCTFEPIPSVGGVTGEKTVEALKAMMPDLYLGSRGGDESQAFAVRCADASGGWVVGTGAAGGNPVAVLPDPAELAERARQRLVLPMPTPRISPRLTLADGRAATLVNEHTWIWTDPDDWTTQSQRVQVGPVWAEVTARPTRIRFDSGMGHRIACEGPGTPYDRSYGLHAPSPDCGLVFRRSTYGMPDEQTTAEYAISWSVSWRGSTGATDEGGELPDMISRTTESFAVAEAQSLRN